MIYIIINLLFLGLVAWWMYNKICPRLKVGLFSISLILKFAAGFALGYIYFFYYGVGDTINYHQVSTIMANTATTDFNMFLDIFFFHPLPEFANQPRAWFMVQVVSLFHIITNNNYWITSCWFSLFGFSGLYYLAGKISLLRPNSDFASVAAFLFFPSVVFWSSGIIKESIALGCIGFMLGSVIAYLSADRKNYHLVIALIYIIILWQVKYYIAAIWVLVLPPFILSFSPYFKNKKLWLLLVVLIILAGFITLLHPNFYPQRIIDVIYSNYLLYSEFSDQPGSITYPYESADVFFIILNSPLALFASLFLPIWPHELQYHIIVASIENALLLILFSGWLIQKYRSGFRFNKVELMLLVYILILAVFLGLSTPNFGTLSRFRVSFLPFFVWLTLVDNYLLVNFKFYLNRKKLWIKNQ